MLTCELVLNDVVRPQGVVLMSASRLAFKEWQARSDRIQGLPVLISHGQADTDLAFAAGQSLRDWLLAEGAQVRWVEFPQGHQIPLTVWREMRKFLNESLARHVIDGPSAN
jgi:predicted esterase